MPQVLVAGILVAHGLITTMIGAGSVTNPNGPAIAAPSWLGWWPGPFGRSWLFDALHVGSGAAVVGGLVWLAAGVALIAAGLGWLGVPAVSEVWRPLALAGAAIGLVALGLYFHPFYLIALVIDATIVLLVSRAVVVAS